MGDVFFILDTLSFFRLEDCNTDFYGGISYENKLSIEFDNRNVVNIDIRYFLSLKENRKVTVYIHKTDTTIIDAEIFEFGYAGDNPENTTDKINIKWKEENYRENHCPPEVIKTLRQESINNILEDNKK